MTQQRNNERNAPNNNMNMNNNMNNNMNSNNNNNMNMNNMNMNNMNMNNNNNNNSRNNGPPGGLAVYVGNLSYDTSWQTLKDHMRRAGNVDRAEVLSAPDGRSKGCGIVVYQEHRDTQRAMRELQDSMLDGRPIFVRE